MVGKIQEVLPRIIFLVVLFFIFKFVYFVAINIVLSRFRHAFVRRERFRSIKRVLRFFWWVLYFVIAVSVLVQNAGSIIASLGLIGLGLTFALQKPILNLVGWLTIIFKDIYNEGDRIKVGKVVGDVKDIQLMNTVVYSLLENSNVRSEKLTAIPNELVLTKEVENYSKTSNYVREELVISITYESNYKKAGKLLDAIATKMVKENLESYMDWKYKEKTRFDEFLKGILRPGKKESVKSKSKDMEMLAEEFQPRIRMELADSSIQLIVQFLTPYDKIKKNRTRINTAFLDGIKKEKDIEIAYPHMQIVYEESK